MSHMRNADGAGKIIVSFNGLDAQEKKNTCVHFREQNKLATMLHSALAKQKKTKNMTITCNTSFFFVFDGQSPVLKKQTLMNRNKQRMKQQVNYNKAAEKLIQNLV